MHCFSHPTVEDVWRCLAIHLHPIYAFHAVSDEINVKSIVICACFVLHCSLAGLRISRLHPEGQEGLKTDLLGHIYVEKQAILGAVYTLQSLTLLFVTCVLVKERV